MSASEKLKFLVVWLYPVYQDREEIATAELAAQEALKVQRDPESVATQFHVLEAAADRAGRVRTMVVESLVVDYATAVDLGEGQVDNPKTRSLERTREDLEHAVEVRSLVQEMHLFSDQTGAPPTDGMRQQLKALLDRGPLPQESIALQPPDEPVARLTADILAAADTVNGGLLADAAEARDRLQARCGALEAELKLYLWLRPWIVVLLVLAALGGVLIGGGLRWLLS